MTHPPPYEEISCCPVSRQLRARDAGSARSLDAGSDAEDEIIARDPLVREPPPSCRHWLTGRPPRFRARLARTREKARCECIRDGTETGKTQTSRYGNRAFGRLTGRAAPPRFLDALARTKGKLRCEHIFNERVVQRGYLHRRSIEPPIA